MENKENKVVSNEIERSKMYVNVGMIELTPEMLEKTTDEKIAEIERQKYQLNKEKEQLEEVSEKQLDIEGIETSEDRMAAALTILEKERELQEMREKEQKKEIRSKKIKRTVKLVILVAIMLVLLFAWLSGYRIPVPDAWVIRVQEIWNAAVRWVQDYFVAG
ncbi:MAG: hypothetical protein IJE45_01420 [Bacilli bacterium]|nr:hypothetical protein [Bacilli bacterium]